MICRVLVVDGDEASVESLELALRRADLEPISALDRVTAVSLFEELQPSVVLIAVRAGGLDAKELARTLRAKSAEVPLLFMGLGAPEDPIRAPSEALDAGGDYYFRLPTDLGYLAGRVRGWAHSGAADPALPDARHDELYALSAELDGDLDLEGLHTPEGRPHRPENLALAALRSTAGVAPSGAISFPAAPRSTTAPARSSPLPATPPPAAPSLDPVPPAIDTARALVREAEALRAAGQVEEAIETYHAAASMYAQDGEVRPALALYKLLLYLDPVRLELACEGALFAARHGENADARALVDRSAKALEKAGRQLDALDLVLRFVEQAGPDPHLMAMRRRLEASVPAPDGPWGTALDEAVAEQEKLLSGPPLAPAWRDEGTLDVLGLEVKPSDDLYPDTRELGHPPTRDLGDGRIIDVLPRVEAQDLIIEDPIEDVAEPPASAPPCGIESAAANLAAFRDTPKPAVWPTAPADSHVQPINVSRGATASTFQFPTADNTTASTFQFPTADNIPKTSPAFGHPAAVAAIESDTVISLPEPLADDEWAATDDEEEFESKTEEIDISEISELVAIQASGFQTEEIMLYDPEDDPGPRRAPPVLPGLPELPELAVSPALNELGPVPLTRPVAPLNAFGTPSMPPRAPSSAQGTASDLQDALEVLGELHAIGANGVLRGLESQLVFADGQPAALRGEQACRALLREAENTHPLPLDDLPEIDEALTAPVALARRLVARGVMSTAESTAFLFAQLEHGLQFWLTSPGPWQFRAEKIRQEDVLAPLPDVRCTLIDLLAGPSVDETILDPDLIIRSAQRDADFLEGRDERFVALLDGQHSVAEAARIAGLSGPRAAAVGMVLLGFRLGVVVGRQRRRARSGRAGTDGASRAAANLASFPTLAPRTAVAGGPHDALSTLPAPARLRALAEMVRTSDYFTMLGIDENASRREIDEAHNRLRGMVPSATEHQDPTSTPVAREVIRSLDEARDVLKVPELRTAYLRHLHR